MKNTGLHDIMSSDIISPRLGTHASVSDSQPNRGHPPRRGIIAGGYDIMLLNIISCPTEYIKLKNEEKEDEYR